MKQNYNYLYNEVSVSLIQQHGSSHTHVHTEMSMSINKAYEKAHDYMYVLRMI